MHARAAKERYEGQGRRSRRNGEGLRLLTGGEAPFQPAAHPDGVVDAQLVARTLEGDARAFEALVRRHLRSAMAAARPLVRADEDAEDVCQDAFIRALERLEDCRDPAKFRSWLLAIVRNRAHNVRKYERRREAEALDSTPVSAPERPDLDLERAELGRRLSEALGHLTEKQRSVVILHDYEGWQHSEIGRALGMSAGASRFSLHTARKKLRLLLAETDTQERTP